MEKPKIIILLISLILMNCDQGTTIKIINDTGSSVEIMTNGEKEIILPNDAYFFIFLGSIPPNYMIEENKEFIVANFKKISKTGFYIIYLGNIYHLTPNSATKLLINNSTFDQDKGAFGTFTYFINLSEVISEVSTTLNVSEER